MKTNTQQKCPQKKYNYFIARLRAGLLNNPVLLTRINEIEAKYIAKKVATV
jgi:hypothetical protein